MLPNLGIDEYVYNEFNLEKLSKVFEQFLAALTVSIDVAENCYKIFPCGMKNMYIHTHACPCMHAHKHI